MKAFLMPDIGEGIVECEIQRWLVAEGDYVTEDQAVAEVLTDKAAVEISSMYSGRIHQLHYSEGDMAKVHEPLFTIDVDSDSEVVESEKPETDISPKESYQPANKTMEEPFVLPDIGEGVTECEVISWQVKLGDHVNEDQVVVEVSTDKAIVEIPSKFTGTVTAIHVLQGEIAKVGEVLFVVEVASDESNNQATQEQNRESHSSNQNQNTIQSSGGNATSQANVKTSHGSHGKQPSGKVLASPAVRRVAKENQISLSEVVGTGEKGRILKHDVMAYLDAIQSNGSLGSSESHTVNEATIKTDVIEQPMSHIQMAMARQMLRSVNTIPHFTVSDEVEMDELMALRESLKPSFVERGTKLSIMPLFIKTLSAALLDYPIVNARITETNNSIAFLPHHNIGFAVDSPSGLLVPNIKKVESLSLEEVAVEFNRLVEDARAGKLMPKDMQGGTITLSNVGALGGITATPIINYPESAIVALGKVQKLPRFDDTGSVVAKHIMAVSWSGDHRLLDGATMVRFNNLWKELIENPRLMLAKLR